MDYRIISIGTLSRNEFWDEPAAIRTPHATTTLIRSGQQTILVDPGLPPQVIAAKLHERAGLKPDQITDVFLTNFRPAHRWGLAAFPQARWLISESEREFVGQRLVEQYRLAEESDVKQMLEQEIALLKKCQAAPDKLAPQVDLFPLPGFTAGTCGLLLALAAQTVLIAGDAVATQEHLERGQVLRDSWDVAQARESLAEALEIADILVPGHDNIMLNPARHRLPPSR